MNLEVGQSMFDTIGRPPIGAPTPAQMEEKMKEMLRPQKVNLTKVVVKTYDLGNAVQVEDYEKDMRKVMLGIPLKTHVILARPPLQFVNDERGGARYVAHMQWAEFELVEKVAPTVPSYQSPAVPPKQASPKPPRKTARIEE